jgi:RNA polymerase subunit RPABC4/transcription elongation factor Spt4
MALKKCKECGKEISTEAKVCPNCGKKNPTGERVGCVAAVLILIAIAAVVSIFSNDEKSTPTVQTVLRPPLELFLARTYRGSRIRTSKLGTWVLPL